MAVSRSVVTDFTHTLYTVMRMISTPPLRQDEDTAWPLFCTPSILNRTRSRGGDVNQVTGSNRESDQPTDTEPVVSLDSTRL